MRNRFLKAAIIIFVVAIIFFFGIGYLSSYVGWYGYGKWKDRKHSLSIDESISRNVFVKKLMYKIENYSGDYFEFKPFIEKGFRWGHNASKETIILKTSDFPYQISYNYRPTKEITILIQEGQSSKFDSANRYLKKPALSDTILLVIGGKKNESGIIKVW